MMLSVSYAKMSTDDIQKAYAKSYKYERSQNPIDAIKALKLVLMHYPDAYTVNLRLGFLFLRHRHFANAEAHYQKASKAMPNALSPKLGLMSVAIAKQNYGKAESIGFKIIKADYFNYYGNLKLAYALKLQKKYEAAQKIVFKMLSIVPEDVNFMVESAQLYAYQKYFALTLSTYKNVLILDPENVAANYYISLYIKK
jgi:Tfp pilus assembly protein PilF